jgi:hypothetical protein
MGRLGEMPPADVHRQPHGISALMERWELAPDDLLPPSPSR